MIGERLIVVDTRSKTAAVAEERMKTTAFLEGRAGCLLFSLFFPLSANALQATSDCLLLSRTRCHSLRGLYCALPDA